MTEARATTDEPKKLFVDYGNKNLFYCGGRCLSGPDRLIFTLAVCGTVIPITCWYIFEAPWFWANVSPAIPIVVAYLFLHGIVFHFICAFTDPGILPRRRFEEPEEDGDPWAMTRRLPASSKKLQVNGVTITVKWCKTCSIYRPPRAIHCATCDNCVINFDHHCPWTGNCVGKRNYRWFLLYVGFISTLAILVEATSIAKMVLVATRMPPPVTQHGMFWSALVYAVYALPVIGFTGFLFYYHLFLSCLGLTTNERLKGIYRRNNPFSKGCVANLRFRFCGYMSARYLKFHEFGSPLPDFPDNWTELGEEAPELDHDPEIEREFEELAEYL